MQGDPILARGRARRPLRPHPDGLRPLIGTRVTNDDLLPASGVAMVHEATGHAVVHSDRSIRPFSAKMRSKAIWITEHPAISAAVVRLFSALQLKQQLNEDEYHVLLCAPGQGNMGDQAMLEAFLERVPGDIRLIAKAAVDVDVPSHSVDRVTVLELPSLLYGALPARLPDLLKFRRLLRNAKSLSIVGADIMDGYYNARASINRAVLAWLACKLGVSCRVLGFSWAPGAHEHALSVLRAAADAGTTLFARDPISSDRLRSAGVVGVVDASDVVFSAEQRDNSAVKWLAKQTDGTRQFAIINVSGLLQRRSNLLEEYELIARHLMQLGLDVILLPHVSRAQTDDRAACQSLYERIDDRKTNVVLSNLLTPEQTRDLCAQARIVVTGRMHLAVIALSQGVPSVALASQGKVEGLMALFGSERMCVEPRIGFGAQVNDLIDDVLHRGGTAAANIAEKLHYVRELSLRNFEGIR